jgi:hypothetical protein
MLAGPGEVKVTKVEFSTQITLENLERVITRNAQLLDGKERYWYVHPLNNMTEELLVDALSQDFYAAHNFETSYSSKSSALARN